MKDIKEKFDNRFPYKGMILEDDGRHYTFDDIWNFILKEAIPMVEKKTREEIIKEFWKAVCNPKPQYATKNEAKEILK